MVVLFCILGLVNVKMAIGVISVTDVATVVTSRRTASSPTLLLVLTAVQESRETDIIAESGTREETTEGTHAEATIDVTIAEISDEITDRTTEETKGETLAEVRTDVTIAEITQETIGETIEGMIAETTEEMREGMTAEKTEGTTEGMIAEMIEILEITQETETLMSVKIMIITGHKNQEITIETMTEDVMIEEETTEEMSKEEMTEATIKEEMTEDARELPITKELETDQVPMINADAKMNQITEDTDKMIETTLKETNHLVKKVLERTQKKLLVSALMTQEIDVAMIQDNSIHP